MQIFIKIDRKKNKLFSCKDLGHCLPVRLYINVFFFFKGNLTWLNHPNDTLTYVNMHSNKYEFFMDEINWKREDTDFAGQCFKMTITKSTAQIKIAVNVPDIYRRGNTFFIKKYTI